MGEVYRARDTKLHRDVALKILPDVFATDADRLARFDREAQLLASLNHPHIAAIHGIEESNGMKALVLELVEGATLADVIGRDAGRSEASLQATAPSASEAWPPRGGGAPRGLKIDEALPIARQIADALEAAHEKGVVHRDLKPANIKLTPDGNVKVLDFGLAKLVEGGAGGAGALSMSPTLSVHATYAGVILGTAAYMSPEQARGRTVDKRTDVWAFGCVLFEMLTAARAFEGDDVAETIGAVIHKEPDWSKLPPTTPATIRTVVQRCLQKDPKQRIRDIGDVRLALGGAFDSPAQHSIAQTRTARNISFAGLAACALIGVLALPIALRHLREQAAELRPVRFSMMTPPAGPAPNHVALSPDGRMLTFGGYDERGTRQLWLRPLDALTSRPVAGTEGAQSPFWSPDSRVIGFYAAGKIKKVGAVGGAAQTICDLPAGAQGALGGEGASWNRDAWCCSAMVAACTACHLPAARRLSF